MQHKVLIVGAGQLGSRYLQGLARVSLPLQIHVRDVSPASLKRAKARWTEVAAGDSLHEVLFAEGLSNLPPRLDLAIVATTADVRPEVVETVSRNAVVRYWILEKVLAQSDNGILAIQTAVARSDAAWVNTPRRVMDWHRQIKASIHVGEPISLVVAGGAWGLACNSVHFLDLLQWWTGETLTEVDVNGLQPNWVEARRLGFSEPMGRIVATFSGSSVAMLTVSPTTDPVQMEMRQQQLEWSIKESAGVAVRSDGLELRGRINLQGELTSSVVESLLRTGACELPSLAESAALHRVFVRAMLAHWNQHMDLRTTNLPIT